MTLAGFHTWLVEQAEQGRAVITGATLGDPSFDTILAGALGVDSLTLTLGAVPEPSGGSLTLSAGVELVGAQRQGSWVFRQAGEASAPRVTVELMATLPLTDLGVNTVIFGPAGVTEVQLDFRTSSPPGAVLSSAATLAGPLQHTADVVGWLGGSLGKTALRLRGPLTCVSADDETRFSFALAERLDGTFGIPTQSWPLSDVVVGVKQVWVEDPATPTVKAPAPDDAAFIGAHLDLLGGVELRAEIDPDGVQLIATGPTENVLGDVGKFLPGSDWSERIGPALGGVHIDAVTIGLDADGLESLGVYLSTDSYQPIPKLDATFGVFFGWSPSGSTDVRVWADLELTGLLMFHAEVHPLELSLYGTAELEEPLTLRAVLDALQLHPPMPDGFEAELTGMVLALDANSGIYSIGADMDLSYTLSPVAQFTLERGNLSLQIDNGSPSLSMAAVVAFDELAFDVAGTVSASGVSLSGDWSVPRAFALKEWFQQNSVVSHLPFPTFLLPDEVELNDLGFELDSGTSELVVHGAVLLDWTHSLAGKELTAELKAHVQHADAAWSGGISATVAWFDGALSGELSFAFGTEETLHIALAAKDLPVTELLGHFDIKLPTPPRSAPALDHLGGQLALDLTWSDGSFRDAVFTAEFLGLGGFLELVHHSSWGVQLGFWWTHEDSEKWDPNTLLGPLEDFVLLENVSLFISSLAGNQGTPLVPAPLVGHAPTGFPGSVEGVNFFAAATLGNGRATQWVKKTFGLDPKLDVYAFLGTAGGGVYGQIEDLTVSFGGGWGDRIGIDWLRVGAALVDETLLAMIGLKVVVPVPDSWGNEPVKFQPLHVEAIGRVEEDGFLIAGEVDNAWAEPFGIAGLTLGPIALMFGLDTELVPSLGFSGAMAFRGYYGMLSVFFDSDNPQQSLLAGSLSNIEASALLEFAKLLDEGVRFPSEAEAILTHIALKGVELGSVPVAAEVVTGLRDMKIDTALANGFETLKHPLPTAPEKISIYPDRDDASTPATRWFVADRMRHDTYHLVLSEDGSQLAVSWLAQLYVVPSDIAIGDWTFQQGFRLDGVVEYLDFQVVVEVNISRTQGLLFFVQLEHGFELLGHLKVRAGEARHIQGGTTRQTSNWVEPFPYPDVLKALPDTSGPYFFLSTYEVDVEGLGKLPAGLRLSAEVELCSFKAQVEFEASLEGLEGLFHFSIGEQSAHLALTVRKGFFDGDCNVQLNFSDMHVPAVVVDDVELFPAIDSGDIAMHLLFHLTVDGEQLSVKGDFTVQLWGLHLRLKLDHDTLESLKEALHDVLKNLSAWFKEEEEAVAQWVEAVVNGVVKDAEKIEKAVVAFAKLGKLAVEEAVSVLKKIGLSVAVIYRMLGPIYADIDVKQALLKIFGVQVAFVGLAGRAAPKSAPESIEDWQDWMVATDQGLRDGAFDSTAPGKAWVIVGELTSSVGTIRLLYQEPGRSWVVVDSNLPGAEEVRMDLDRLEEGRAVYSAGLLIAQEATSLALGPLRLELPFGSAEYGSDGNWNLDFGFPYDDDWSRAGGVKMPGLWAGLFGAYLAPFPGPVPHTDLEGEDLPQTVLAVGLALRMELQGSISVGPLSGGFDASWSGQLHGRAGFGQFTLLDRYGSWTDWFSPRAYQLEGSLRSQGHIWGTVDFSVVRASLNVSFDDLVAMQLSSRGDPPDFGRRIEVKVSAKLEVDMGLFTVTKSFPYHTKLAIGTLQGVESLEPLGLPRFDRVQAPSEKVSLRLCFAPEATLTFQGTQRTVHTVSSLSLRYDGGESCAFTQLCDVVAGWALQACGVEHGSLATLRAVRRSLRSKPQLSRTYPHLGEPAEAALNYGTLWARLDEAFTITIGPLEEADHGATLIDFPMPAELSLIGTVGPPEAREPRTLANFWETVSVSPAYERDLDRLFASITPGRHDDPPPLDGQARAIVEVVFEDWFQALSHGVIEARIQALEAGRTVEETDYEALAGSMCLFFRNGLRLPLPEGQGDAPLFELTGQQHRVEATDVDLALTLQAKEGTTRFVIAGAVQPMQPVFDKLPPEDARPAPPGFEALPVYAGHDRVFSLEPAVPLRVQNVADATEVTWSLASFGEDLRTFRGDRAVQVALEQDPETVLPALWFHRRVLTVEAVRDAGGAPVPNQYALGPGGLPALGGEAVVYLAYVQGTKLVTQVLEPSWVRVTGRAGDQRPVSASLAEPTLFAQIFTERQFGEALTLFYSASPAGAATAGAGLPAELFDSAGRAEIWLLVAQAVAGVDTVVPAWADGVLLQGKAGPTLNVRTTAPGDQLTLNTSPPGLMRYRQVLTPLPSTDPGAWLQALYSFSAAQLRNLGDGGRKSPWTLPQGVVTTAEGDWSFTLTLPYARFALGTDDSDYAGVGELYQASFELRDAFGNRYQTQTVPPTTPTFTDPLLSPASWPGVELKLTVDSGEFVLALVADLEALKSFDPQVARTVLDRVHGQLTHYTQLFVRSTVDGIRQVVTGPEVPDFVVRLRTWLDTQTGSIEPVALRFPLGTSSSNAVSLGATFGLKRTAYVSEHASPPPENLEVQEVVAVLGLSEAPTAIPGRVLARGARGWMGVRAEALEWSVASGRWFGLAPLSNRLVSDRVSVPVFDPTSASPTGEAEMVFAELDIEHCARTVFTQLDSLLRSPSIADVAEIDAMHAATLLQLRWALADRIATQRTAPVFAGVEEAPSTVVEAMRTRLRSRSMELFDLAATVAFEVTGAEGVGAAGPVYKEGEKVQGLGGRIAGPGTVAFPLERSQAAAGTWVWQVTTVLIDGRTLLLDAPVDVPLGSLVVPALPRDFPSPPTLLERTWRPSESPEPEPAALEWSVGVQIETQATSMDDTHLEVRITEATVPNAGLEGLSLAQALFRAQQVFTSLEVHLASLPAAARDRGNAQRAVVLNVFTALEEACQTVVDAHWSEPPAEVLERYRLHTATDGKEDVLTLSGLGSTVERLTVWPLQDDGTPVPDATAGPVTADERSVRYPCREGARQRRSLTLGPLRLPAEAAVEHRLHSERNRQLAGKDVDPRFRLYSNPVGFQDPQLPAIDRSSTVCLAADWGTSGAKTLEAWLRTLLEPVVTDAPRMLQLEARLEWPRFGEGPTETLLRPVALTITRPSGAGDDLLATIRAQIGKRTLGNGWLSLDVALFAVDAAHRLTQLPRLRIPLDQITDLRA